MAGAGGIKAGVSWRHARIGKLPVCIVFPKRIRIEGVRSIAELEAGLRRPERGPTVVDGPARVTRGGLSSARSGCESCAPRTHMRTATPPAPAYCSGIIGGTGHCRRRRGALSERAPQRFQSRHDMRRFLRFT